MEAGLYGTIETISMYGTNLEKFLKLLHSRELCVFSQM